MSKKNQPQTYERFPVWRRIEHFVMVLSFSTLGLTGLPQKYPSSAAGSAILQALGGIEYLRFIHHTAAIVMMFGTAYHILVMGYSVFVLRRKMSMLPTLQDVKDGFQALFYNMGFMKKYPKMGRYTFEEKLEYWAFVWGAAVMGATGFLMWNPITATRYLSGQFVPAAKAAHGGEAVLAVLAIFIWHIYSVHIKRFNKAMFTGLQTEAEMLHEHPLELAEIKAGTAAHHHLDAATLRKRKMIYYPIAAFLTLGMLAGIFAFINSEETALTTITPLTETQIYAPQTPQP